MKVSWDSGIPRDLGTYKLEPAMAEVILDKESENYYGYMLKVNINYTQLQCSGSRRSLLSSSEVLKC